MKNPLHDPHLASLNKTFSLAEEFKKFAFKGNVVDMAVGVVVGAAFGKIIDSLVKNIIMPVISLIMPSNQDYLSWKIVIGAKVVPYGLFIGDVVNFTIISLVVFIFIVKVLGGLTKFKQAEVQTAAVAPPAITKDQELLTEIRDLLKKE